MVTILNTLGRSDFYDQIVLQSMSTLHVLLLCDILLDIIMLYMYLCISSAFISHHMYIPVVHSYKNT